MTSIMKISDFDTHGNVDHQSLEYVCIEHMITMQIHTEKEEIGSASININEYIVQKDDQEDRVYKLMEITVDIYNERVPPEDLNTEALEQFIIAQARGTLTNLGDAEQITRDKSYEYIFVGVDE